MAVIRTYRVAPAATSTDLGQAMVAVPGNELGPTSTANLRCPLAQFTRGIMMEVEALAAPYASIVGRDSGGPAFPLRIIVSAPPSGSATNSSPSCVVGRCSMSCGYSGGNVADSPTAMLSYSSLPLPPFISLPFPFPFPSSPSAFYGTLLVEV